MLVRVVAVTAALGLAACVAVLGYRLAMNGPGTGVRGRGTSSESRRPMRVAPSAAVQPMTPQTVAPLPPPAEHPSAADTPTGHPDFVIVAQRMEPDGPMVRSGTQLHFVFEIANNGTADVPPNGAIAIVGPGNSSGFVTHGLAVGETKEATVDMPVYGSMMTKERMRFTVDPDDIWKDSNRNNNRSQWFEVSIYN
jgi:hypothetical protein